MEKNKVIALAGRDTIVDPLTDLLRTGAEKLIFQAVEAELQELPGLYSDRRTDAGLAGVVRMVSCLRVSYRPIWDPSPSGSPRFARRLARR